MGCDKTNYYYLIMLQAVTLHPEWVLGFIDAEGCFHVAIQNNRTMRLGVQVQLQFCITQHAQDHVLMTRFIDFFGVGSVVKDGPSKYQYRIRSMDHLEQHLFPFLDCHSLLTCKANDYLQFRKVHALMRTGAHLTPEGLAEIRNIQQLMNRQRMK